MEQDEQRSGGLKKYLVSLFGLPFLAIGLFALRLVASSILESQRMETWPTVDARIEDAKLETHEENDDDGRSVTYNTTARYVYEYEGVSYTGTRVSLSSASDSIGSFHQDVFKELDLHRTQGTPFRSYVNPANPAESILYPQLRSGLLGLYGIFALIFGGGGALMVFSPLFGRKSRTHQTSQSSSRVYAPLKPWEEREEWRKGVSQSSTKGAFFLFLIFSIVWTGGSSFAIMPAVEGVRAGKLSALLPLIFPLIGLVMFACSINLFLKWRKFGVSTLRLKTIPAQPGESLEGEIEVTRPLERGTEVELTLACNKRYTTGTGKDRRTETKKLWSHQWKVAPQPIGGKRGSRVPVSCAIPQDAEETCSVGQISWDLGASAAVPGVDFVAHFEVPVFFTDIDNDEALEDEELETEQPQT